MSLTMARLLGVDRAIAYTLTNRSWNILAGPITIFLIARALRPEAQGYYYTFGSLLALNVFFELGLNNVIVQFVSHERAVLKLSCGVLIGPEQSMLRMATLLQYSVRYYLTAAAAMILTLLPSGIVFFKKAHGTGPAEVDWVIPWAWLVVVSGLNLTLIPLFAITEGCGKIAEVASLRLVQSVLSTVGLWIALSTGLGLLAAPIFQTLSFIVAALLLFRISGPLLHDLWVRVERNASTNISGEVWPLQWRIALSWVSGFLIFQLFNPVLFATQGPRVAGQMGMSLSLCNAIFGASISWITTKAPAFGTLVARRDWKSLDNVFFRALGQSSLIFLLGGALLVLLTYMLRQNEHFLATRLLPPALLAILLASTLMNHVTFSLAAYLRSHKQEPYLWTSVAAAILIGGSTIVTARAFGVGGVCIAYAILNGVGCGVAVKIFLNKRALWHSTSVV